MSILLSQAHLFGSKSGPGIAILSMDNRPSAQGGGSGVITNTPFSVDSSTNLTITGADALVRIRVAGARGSNPPPSNFGGLGHYVEATVLMLKDQTYYLYKEPRYASVNAGANQTTQPTVILLGAEGGHGGSQGPISGRGGDAGLPSAQVGQSVGSQGGGGGASYGYLSGGGGYGGSAGGSPGLPQSDLQGRAGGAMYPGPAPPGANTYDGLGGRGGMGYYGGGGGGGGWQYGPGPQGAGGGGGSSYASGLPPAAPVPAPVSTINASGTNTSGSYITFVSWEPA